MRTLIALAAAVLSTAAYAETVTTSCKYDPAARTTTCRTEYLPGMNNNARVIHVPEPAPVESANRWAARCKPESHSEGSTVWFTYASPDCE